MDNQKDYINNFRKEAEAIVLQQLADLRNHDGNDSGLSAIRSQASPNQLRVLEEELRNSVEHILREASEQSNKEELRNELMNFYQDYVDDFAERVEQKKG